MLRMLYCRCQPTCRARMRKAFLSAVRSTVGEWLSLVEPLVRDQGVGGSNPLSPTNLFKYLNCASGFPSTSLVSKVDSHFPKINHPPSWTYSLIGDQNVPYKLASPSRRIAKDPKYADLAVHVAGQMRGQMRGDKCGDRRGWHYCFSSTQRR